MSAHRGIVLQKYGSQILRGVGAAIEQRCGDHVATRQTHRRFWQRVCGSIERRLSLVSFFGENLAAAAFGTFVTLSGAKRTSQNPRSARNGYYCLLQPIRKVT